MKREDKARPKLVKSFERKRAKHKALLAKIEKTRARLAKRTLKLQKLEAKIANLERRIAGLPNSKTRRARSEDSRMRRARLIVNPNFRTDNADNSQQLAQMVGYLRDHGIQAEIELKTSGKAARQLAQEAVNNKDDLIIVAGGDGTIEDVASQLVNTRTTLGIIPVGTMNNLARSLGIPLRIEEACQLIGMGVARQIDVGRVVNKEKSGTAYFMELAGIGLSAVVIPTGQAVEKHHWAVLPSALRKLFDSQPEPIQVQLDDGQWIQASSQIVTVSNAPLTGRNLLIAPDAKMDDGQLDIAIYDQMDKTELLQYFSGTGNGSRPQNPHVRFYRSSRVRIRAGQDMEANSDKEVLNAKQDFEIEVVPHSLNVIVGKGVGLSLPMEAAPSVPPLAGPQQPSADQKRQGNGNHHELAKDAHQQ